MSALHLSTSLSVTVRLKGFERGLFGIRFNIFSQEYYGRLPVWVSPPKSDSSFSQSPCSVCVGQVNDETAPRRKEQLSEDNVSLSLPVKASKSEEEDINEKAASITRPKMAVFMFVLNAMRIVRHPNCLCAISNLASRLILLILQHGSNTCRIHPATFLVRRDGI